MGFCKSSTQDPDRPSLLFDDFHEKCSPMSTCVQPCDASYQPSRYNSSVLSFDKFEGLILPEIFHDFQVLQENSLHTLLAENLQSRLSVEVLRPYAHLQQQSFNASLRFTTETFLSLRTPCTAPGSQLHFE
jgi:hypothetical protein